MVLGGICTIGNSTDAAYSANYPDRSKHIAPAINANDTIKITVHRALWKILLEGLHYIPLCRDADGWQPEAGCLESVQTRHEA